MKNRIDKNTISISEEQIVKYAMELTEVKNKSICIEDVISRAFVKVPLAESSIIGDNTVILLLLRLKDIIQEDTLDVSISYTGHNGETETYCPGEPKSNCAVYIGDTLLDFAGDTINECVRSVDGPIGVHISATLGDLSIFDASGETPPVRDEYTDSLKIILHDRNGYGIVVISPKK